MSTELPPPTTTADQQQWITEHWAGPMLGQIMELIAAGELNEGECWVVGMVVGGHIKWPTIRDDGLLILPPLDAVCNEVRQTAAHMAAEAAARGVAWPPDVDRPTTRPTRPPAPTNRAARRRAARHRR